ncbi:metal-sensing transcriptional repressor [Halobacillus massiliensis]|uniref:metal-sensing transcriptional repressor n=1 Tax=Halobacillus massiliensis TaxID=1926286 RepID=UPI001FE8E2D1|nr:metal-sensing transcriptional repressor [Halobacillus massiliensis]
MKQILPENSSKKSVKLRSVQEKAAVINRLKHIEKQVRGIQSMVENDRYSVEITAINNALNKVGHSLLERHTHHCVANAIKNGNSEKAIDELMKVAQHFSK